MPDTTPPDTQTEQGKFSPFAGCSIFLIAGALIIGMITFSLWMGTRVESTIKGFTTEQPRIIEQTDLQGKENQQVALKNKLVAFRHQIEAKKKGALTLSAEEMNLAIATFDILQPQRGYLHVASITEEGIRAEISNPINSKISNLFSKDEDKTFRYLNGSIIIQPEVVGDAIFPRITALKPEVGGSVPNEFQQQLSKTLLIPFKDDPEIGPLFTRISSVELSSNSMEIKTDPEYQAEENVIVDTQPALDRFMKGFAVIAVIFLSIVAVVIFLSRRKAQQS